MDIRSFISKKRATEPDSDNEQEMTEVDEELSSEEQSSEEIEPESTEPQPVITNCQKKRRLSMSENKKAYKARLTYKKEWEKKYPWVTCDDPSNGMFCKVENGELLHLAQEEVGQPGE